MEITIQVYLTSDRMPEKYQSVLVAGGTAYWTGKVWVSTSGYQSYDRPLTWTPQWWAPLITNGLVCGEASYNDVAASGGIVDAP